MNAFSITYEIITNESAEYGDAEERGFIDEGLTLREAMDALHWYRGSHVEADSYPLARPRWFTFHDVETNWTTGDTKNVSLHLPETLTDSTRRRIARLVGCYKA